MAILLPALLVAVAAAGVPGVGPPSRYSGKIALVDATQNRVAIDPRERDGAKAGDRLQVTREGEKVGVLVIQSVQKWGCWAVPEGDTAVETFQKGDRLND